MLNDTSARAGSTVYILCRKSNSQEIQYTSAIQCGISVGEYENLWMSSRQISTVKATSGVLESA